MTIPHTLGRDGKLYPKKHPDRKARDKAIVNAYRQGWTMPARS